MFVAKVASRHLGVVLLVLKSVFDVRITAECVLQRLSPVSKRMVHMQEVKLQDIQIKQCLQTGMLRVHQPLDVFSTKFTHKKYALKGFT